MWRWRWSLSCAAGEPASLLRLLLQLLPSHKGSILLGADYTVLSINFSRRWWWSVMVTTAATAAANTEEHSAQESKERPKRTMSHACDLHSHQQCQDTRVLQNCIGCIQN